MSIHESCSLEFFSIFLSRNSNNQVDIREELFALLKLQFTKKVKMNSSLKDQP